MSLRTIQVALTTLFALFSFPNARAAIIVGPWIPIFRGVDRARGEADASEPKLQKVNVLRIDLKDPDLELFSTPSNGDAPPRNNRPDHQRISDNLQFAGGGEREFFLARDFDSK